jgi:hypothetical protein
MYPAVKPCIPTAAEGRWLDEEKKRVRDLKYPIFKDENIKFIYVKNQMDGRACPAGIAGWVTVDQKKHPHGVYLEKIR